MTTHPPPQPPARPFYREPRTAAWLLAIGALIAIGVVRQRAAAPQLAQPPQSAVQTSPQTSPRTSTRAAAGGSPATSASQSTSTPRPRPTRPPLIILTPSPSAATATSPSTAPPALEQEFLFTMPDFTGVRLQNAQNTVQGLGVYLSRSHDLLGSRKQVLDRNWQVCTQSVAAGTRVTGKASDLEGKIDFGVVKTSERCP